MRRMGHADEEAAAMTLDEISRSDDYLLFCAGRLSSPFALYRCLREVDPVHWNAALEAWILTRYRDILPAFLDPRLSSQRIPFYMRQIPEPLQARVEPLARHFQYWIGMTDPPDHTRLRVLISKAF